METVTMRDGRVVLAKNVPGYGLMAKTYANFTQATTAASKVGGCVFGRRPFYVWIRTEQQ